MPVLRRYNHHQVPLLHIWKYEANSLCRADKCRVMIVCLTQHRQLQYQNRVLRSVDVYAGLDSNDPMPDMDLSTSRVWRGPWYNR